MSYSATILRDYQQEAVDSIINYFIRKKGNPLVVLPTGAGKSHVIAEFIKLVMGYPNQRVMMLTHVKELIEQNLLKLCEHWPNAPNIGIYSSALKKRDKYDDIIFASIQSVYKRAEEFGKLDLIVIDECHLISHSDNTMYRKFINDLKLINPYLKIVGLTATPFRTSTGDITKSKDSLFDGICYEKPMIELINDGYLSPLVSKRTETEIDLSSVKVRGGEFVNKDLQEATDKEIITRQAVNEIISYGCNRKSWLIFCAGVDHANHVRDEFIAQGIKAASVTGNTPNAQREQIIQDYKDGNIKALCNANVLTTGFDAPETDLLAMLRGTQSPGLYVQIVGRGTRLADGKENCLVLDFAGNVMRHGPVDQVRPWVPKERGGTGEMLCKDCPKCKLIVSVATKTCPNCGYAFPFEEKPKHKAHSDNVAIISTESIIEEHTVNNVHFNLHKKRFGTPSLRVEYNCGINIFKEWICLFHDGFAKRKADYWWNKFVNKEQPKPQPWIEKEDFFEISIKPILDEYHQKPKAIIVNHSGQYPTIINYKMGEIEYDQTTK